MDIDIALFANVHFAPVGTLAMPGRTAGLRERLKRMQPVHHEV